MFPVQQPAFQYQRRAWEPDEEDYEDMPEQSASAVDMRGGAGAAPRPRWNPPAATSRQAPDLSGIEAPGMSEAEPPSVPGLQGGGVAQLPGMPAPATSGYRRGPAQQRLEEMTQQGPRKSLLGRIAAAGIGAAVGYTNASGRVHIPMPTEAMGKMVNRAPNLPPPVSSSNTPGLIEPGNINLANRPRVRNRDGSVSTVRSISVNVDDGKEVLIPTVTDDGRVVSNSEAIANYQRTGKHLGVFDTPEHATGYAQQLHQQQANQLKGGGAWADKLAQAQQLAGFEQQGQQRDIAAAGAAAQQRERDAQTEYYGTHGRVLEEQAQTARLAESDRQKREQVQRITAMGGRTPQIRTFPKTQPPPVGDWYIADDPYNPGHRIAVRPSPGEEIDKDTAEWLGLTPDEDGKYHATASNVSSRARAKAQTEVQASRDARKAIEDKQRDDEFKLRMKHLEAQLAVTRAQHDGMREDRQNAANTKLDEWKIRQIEDIARNAHVQEGKELAGENNKDSIALIYGTAADAMTQVNAAYARQIRDRGGDAPDWVVHSDGAGKYRWEKTSESYGKGVGVPPKVGTPQVFGAPGTTSGVPQPVGAAAASSGAPPPEVWSKLPAGEHTFGNGQVWRKNADGSAKRIK